MNLKTWIPLALAIVLGLIAMKVARDVLAKRDTPSDSRTPLSEVVVVSRNVPAGTELKAEDLSIAKFGGAVAPESSFRSIDQVEGRVVVNPLGKGQPVMETLLAPKGTGSGLQALVPKGMRAITVEINEFSGLAGFLVPGCRVDVVSTLNDGAGEMVSRTIVQNVEVTALGRRQQQPGTSGEDAEQTRSVTLLVKPKEAEAIELAAATGRPRLVLRSSGDKDLAKSEGITVAELRGRRRPDPFAVPIVDMFRPTHPTNPSTQPSDGEPLTPVSYERPLRPTTRTIRVIRGGAESNVTLELPPEKGEKFITDANK